MINDPNFIPLMTTKPSNVWWKQPDPADIEVDSEYAMMLKEVFDQLVDCSSGGPAGRYIGQMWRRKWPEHEFFKVGDWQWELGWYSFNENIQQRCVNYRRILIV